MIQTGLGFPSVQQYDYANKFQITDVGEDGGIKVKTDTSLQDAVMGCAGSKSVAIAPGKQLYLYMSEEEIKLVQESWEVLKDDLEEVGFLVFQRLLCMHDEVNKLFHMFLTQESSGEYVIDEGKLRTHSRIVMEALGAAVECLDDSDQLTLILISAGQRHANYDVQSNMVLHMWPAVKRALADKLGGGLTNELKRAWEHVFDYIASKFAEGVVVCNKDSINTRHII